MEFSFLILTLLKFCTALLIFSFHDIACDFFVFVFLLLFVSFFSVFPTNWAAASLQSPISWSCPLSIYWLSSTLTDFIHSNVLIISSILTTQELILIFWISSLLLSLLSHSPKFIIVPLSLIKNKKCHEFTYTPGIRIGTKDRGGKSKKYLPSWSSHAI